MIILLGLHIRCTPLGRRRQSVHGLADGGSALVTRSNDRSGDLECGSMQFYKLEFGMSPPAKSPTNPRGAHRRAQSRSDSEREKIRYHFYHFKGKLPLGFARKCDSLHASANAVLFYNSGCRHPLRLRVSGLRNRRDLL